MIEHKLPDGKSVRFGVIDLHDFYDNTAKDVATLVKALEKQDVAGIILDFRNNGGGLLDQAVDLTGLFIDRKEPVVQIRRYDGYIDQLGPDAGQGIYNGPLLVMVNKMSASATEIVAAALQDYGRAIIVGDQSTHGKGTVQTLIPLDNQMPIGFPSEPGPGNLKMTVQKFYRVAGGSTQKKGVVPDIVLPSVLDALELGETTLPYYLDYDTVPAAPYSTFNLVSPYIEQLRTNSTARVTAVEGLRLRPARHRLLQKEDQGQQRVAQRGRAREGAGGPEIAERGAQEGLDCAQGRPRRRARPDAGHGGRPLTARAAGREEGEEGVR